MGEIILRSLSPVNRQKKFVLGQSAMSVGRACSRAGWSAASPHQNSTLPGMLRLDRFFSLPEHPGKTKD
jgi:hypothetical protein